MDVNHIFFIVNLSAGKDEPILEKIDQVFHDSGKNIAVHVLEEKEDPAELVRAALAQADLIVVYGGDGSVTEAAAGMISSGKPLAIIPDGTANVLSKELGIPQEAEAALTFLRDGKYRLKSIDTGTVNGRPFLLRINLGVMAEMITKTDPELKDKIGQVAYGVATIKSLRDASPVDYRLNIDGEHIAATGVSLTVTNSGNMGIGDLQLQPGISVNDGLMDIILLKDASILSLVKAAGGSLLGQETDAVSHWTGKEITVTLPKEQLYLCDDCEAKATELIIKIIPSSLSIAVPME